VVLVLAPVRWPLVALLVIGLAQLVLLLVLGGVARLAPVRNGRERGRSRRGGQRAGL
jgi:hypothetical protein